MKIEADEQLDSVFAGVQIEADEQLDSVFAGVPSIQSPARPSFVTNLPVDTYTLRPLTAKMLIDGFEATDDKWNIKVDDQLVSSVRMIGKMLYKDMSENAMSFTLHDGTGGVPVSYWFEENPDLTTLAGIKDGDYVMLVGRPTSRDDVLGIRAFVVRPVTNYNDVPHHFLHVIFCHLDALKANAKKAKESELAIASSSTVRAPVPIFPGAIPGNVGTEGKILSILRDPAYRDLTYGVTFQLLSRLVDVDNEEIKRATEVLLDIGAVYTTISESQIKASLI